MSKQLKFAAGVGIAVMAGFFLWQQQQIKILQREIVGLERAANEAGEIQEKHRELEGNFQKLVKDSQTERRELMRLRAQSLELRRVEQEKAEVEAKHQRLASEFAEFKAASERPMRQGGIPVIDSQKSEVPAGVADFGVVTFSGSEPTRLELGEGKEAVATATLLPTGDLQTVFVSQKVVDGVPIFSERTMTVTPGKQVFINFDGVEVSFVAGYEP